MTRLPVPRISAIVTGICVTFLVVPLLIVVLFSFHKTAALSFPFEGFSLRWYKSVFETPEFTQAMRNSFGIAVVTAVLTGLLGTLAAYGITQSSFRARGAVAALFMVPMALPALFNGIALLVFFSRTGVEMSRATIVVAHTLVALPFFYVIASTALERLDPSVQEAAADLGASPARVFRKITVPQVAPSLVGAMVLAFMVSLDEFVVTFFVSGGENTLPLFVFSRLRQTLDPSINVVSTLLVLVTVVLGAVALGLNQLSVRRKQHDPTGIEP